MIACITDEVLDHYVVTAPWDELADVLAARYSGLAPSIRLMTYTAIHQYRTDPGVFDRWADVARRLRAVTA
jgi:hypothetical protein